MSVKLIKSLPREDNFRMMGEFEPHQATWLIWPERPDNWRKNATFAQEAFANLANKICQHEPVYMGVSKKELKHAKLLLNNKIKIIKLKSDDAWVRDTGPTIVKNSLTNEIRGVSWIFNSWGGLVDGLYSTWSKDQKIAKKICRTMNIDYYQADFVLEGGSIHTDGLGTLFTTESCLLSKGRNPHLSKQAIEDKLKNYLGIKKVIWLKHGVYQDETNGHVDNMIQIAEDQITILLHWTNDKSDPQYLNSKAAFDLLSKSTNALGQKFKIVKVLGPQPLIYLNANQVDGLKAVNQHKLRSVGERLPASYMNHYVGNKAVYMPVFGCLNDKKAYKQLCKAYPSRKIIKISDASEIILGGGNIHCITQQISK